MADAAVQSPQPAGVDSKERFFRYFQHEVVALKERMDRLGETSAVGGERNFAIDYCLAGIERLSHSVKDASSYIPAYDQRTYGEAIKALAEKLQNIRNSFAPPKKFQFKSARKGAIAQPIPDIIKTSPQPTSPGRISPGRSPRSPISPFSLAKPSALSPLVEKTEGEAVKPKEDLTDVAKTDGVESDKARNDSAHSLDGEETDGVKPDGVDSTKPVSRINSIPLDGTANSSKSHLSSSNSLSISITSKSHAHIILGSSAAHSSNSGTVSNITSSVVDMSQLTVAGKPLAGLILKNINDSLIICGQVAGPIHITDVSNSVVVVACRQFRMHECRGTDVYLHCSSRPIIEDCEDVRFAVLPDVYTTKELRLSKNHWNEIDDFKWLKAEPSPHFSLLKDDEKLKDGVWIDVAPGGSKTERGWNFESGWEGVDAIDFGGGRRGRG